MSDSDARNPQLVWTEAGEPRSGRYDDVYFSAEDGLAETRAVFLQGCDLPQAWAERTAFTVAELGFGTGLNIAALLDMWQQHRPRHGHLNIFSVEGYPLSQDEARRALAAWPEIAAASEALLASWPSGTAGFHRVDLPEFHATLDLAIGDVDWALTEWCGQADAWFLDGFAPSTNPAMWSQTVLDAIAARSAPDARLATFTVAGAVRRGLSERGFAVDKRPGYGRKRERLEARGTGRLVPAPKPRVAVIGAGIAGASVARALKATGITPLIIESQSPGAGASGFPAALVTPRFDLGDAGIAGLFSQALERARDLYQRLPGAVTARGVVQLPTSARDVRRFERIPQSPLWSDGATVTMDAAAISDHLGEPVDETGLLIGPAFAVAPARIVPAWLEGCEILQHEVKTLSRQGDLWCLRSAEDEVICEVDAVVICGGAGNLALSGGLPLTPVRGQATWVEQGTARPAAWGGYVAPIAGGGLLFGATHDRGDTDTHVRADDTRRNLETLASRLPVLASSLSEDELKSRAATRSTTPDRLPIADEIAGSPGLFLLGGLGSRGFCLAPLLGEHLAARVAGSPSPLPASIAARIKCARDALAMPPVQDDPGLGGILQEPV